MLHHVSDLPFEALNGSITMSMVANRHMLALQIGREQVSRNLPRRAVVKRLIDVVFALCAIALLCPLLLVVAGLIRGTMGKGVIFGHRRVGRDGQPFTCLKFRTMVHNGDAVLKTHLAAKPEAAQEWQVSYKLKNDPRVTWLGSALRASSVDELPQLFNVLSGHMSFVGPRPITFHELQRYAHAGLDYMKMRPGLTGPWQIGGRSSVSYQERVALDLAYVRGWTLRNDIVIMLKTVPALLRVGQTS